MYGIIYKITNIINNKVYIGQTTQTLKRRFADHKSRAKTKNGYLYKAIRKYSAEKFKIEQIDIAHTKEELDLKECYWIEYYNALNPKCGYNLKSGGTKDIKCSEVMIQKIREKHVRRKVYCLDTHETFNSIKEAEEKYNCRGYISRACRGKNNIVKGLKWCYLEDKNKPELHIIPENNRKKVYCFEKNKIYRSITDAAKDNNCCPTTIANVCRKNKQKQYLIYNFKKYHFCFLSDIKLFIL